ncbi:hypothetical protein KP509_36G046800 [Ceratopteris richardii]|uniref:Uncharacterized protein n=1 Tax=Ceratopteris richardii TaxID=49495 RepID=A0A8T2QD79_CERRI|nr:hypothetical protein KP509_36G046800 [Ceratopteris richardii]
MVVHCPVMMSIQIGRPWQNHKIDGMAVLRKLFKIVKHEPYQKSYQSFSLQKTWPDAEGTVCSEICNPDHNASCGRSQKRIADLFEAVLGFPVEIKMSLASLLPGSALVRPQVNYPGTSKSGSQIRPLGPHVKRPQQEGQGTEMESEIQRNTTMSEAISGAPHGEQIKLSSIL